MRAIVCLFALGVLISAFAIFLATRTQICQGTWSDHHTVLTTSHCRVQW